MTRIILVLSIVVAGIALATVSYYEFIKDDNNAPIAIIEYSPVEPREKEPVNFSGSQSSDPDQGDTITGYYWDWGDGKTDSTNEITIQHIYEYWGDFIVNLTVKDNRGLQSSLTEMHIYVRPQDTHVDFDGHVNGGQGTGQGIFVAKKAVSLTVNYTLTATTVIPQPEVTLELKNANDDVIRREGNVGPGSGQWVFDETDLTSTGQYQFTITGEEGGMDFEIDLDVHY
tara:strand:+ start:514 stop:1197 length:684 start_codon:yes stop_codon:yes gene_type:complete